MTRDLLAHTVPPRRLPKSRRTVPNPFLKTTRAAVRSFAVRQTSPSQAVCDDRLSAELKVADALRAVLVRATPTPSDARTRYEAEVSDILARLDRIQRPTSDARSLCAQALKRARDRFVETTPSFSEWQTMADILWPDLELLTVPERFIIEAPDPDTSTPLRDNHVRIVRALSEWMETHDANH